MSNGGYLNNIKVHLEQKIFYANNVRNELFYKQC